MPAAGTLETRLRSAHRKVATRRAAMAAAKVELLAVVAEARAQGMSHGQLATVLGVSRARAQELARESKSSRTPLLGPGAHRA
jgi:predicted transcriptional regulator